MKNNNIYLFRQKIIYFLGICVLSTYCSAEGQQSKSTLTTMPTKQEVMDLKKTVIALFPKLRSGTTPGYHPDVREYELIGLTKSELTNFIGHIPYKGNARSMFGGQPELSSNGAELIIFKDPDHGAEYFKLTYKDDRVDTVQHCVGGFVGDRLPGFVRTFQTQAFETQEGPVLNSKQAAMEYALREKDWQIHSKWYGNDPVAIAHFYLVAGKVRMQREEWQKATEDFLVAKSQLSKSDKTASNELPSP